AGLDGVAALATASRASGRPIRAAYPTPIWRWVRSPDRNATAIGISSAGTLTRSAAISSIFARRADVLATAAEVVTISASSTGRLSQSALTAVPSSAHAGRLKGAIVRRGSGKRLYGMSGLQRGTKSHALPDMPMPGRRGGVLVGCDGRASGLTCALREYATGR